MQMYGQFEGFRYTSALFGLVVYWPLSEKWGIENFQIFQTPGGIWCNDGGNATLFSCHVSKNPWKILSPNILLIFGASLKSLKSLSPGGCVARS